MQRPEPVSEEQQKALRDLEALGRERDLLHGLWSGWLLRGSRHFSAADADATDPIELWGRRIGRALAVFAFIAFCIYLYVTYVR
jgi:ferric-dicitrate binding protein FerR (iron transport regulator)